MGLVWSVPPSVKGNERERESPKKGGETYRRWGGPKTFLGRGFSPNLRYVFHPPEFSTPLGRSLNGGVEERFREPLMKFRKITVM